MERVCCNGQQHASPESIDAASVPEASFDAWQSQRTRFIGRPLRISRGFEVSRRCNGVEDIDPRRPARDSDEEAAATRRERYYFVIPLTAAASSKPRVHPTSL
jgi:hypothetical protein